MFGIFVSCQHVTYCNIGCKSGKPAPLDEAHSGSFWWRCDRCGWTRTHYIHYTMSNPIFGDKHP